MIEILLLVDEPTASALVSACSLWGRTHKCEESWTKAMMTTIERQVARAVAVRTDGPMVTITEDELERP